MALPESDPHPAHDAVPTASSRSWLWRGLIMLGVLGLVIGAGAAWGLRYGTSYVPSAWVAERIVNAVSQTIGARGTVKVQHARVRATDQGQRLVVDGFTVTSPDGQAVIAAPRAEIDFDMMTLLFGSDPVRTVELRDLSVRLVMSREGRLSILNEEIAGTGGAGEFAQSDVKTVFGALAAALSGQGAGIRGLDHFSLRNGRLVIDDPTHATQLVYSNLSIQFIEKQKTQREIIIAAERNGRSWSLNAKLLPDAGPEKVIAVSLDRLPLEDVAYLMRTALDEASQIPMNGDVHLQLMEDGRLKHVRVDAVAAGHARKADTDPAAALENVTLKANWAAASQTWTIEQFSANAGLNAVSLSGSLLRDGDTHRLTITNGHMRRALDHDPAQSVTIDTIEGEGQIGAHGDAQLTRLRLAGPSISLVLDGLWPADRTLPARVGLQAGPFSAASGLALWPKKLAPAAHAYVSQRLEKGSFDGLTMTVTIDPAARAAMVQGTAGGDIDVELQTTARDARLRAVDGFPALDMAQLTAAVKGASVIATSPRATVLTAQKTTAAFADIRFDCRCTSEKPNATVQFRATGPAEAAFDLLDTPLLRQVGDGLDGLDAISGTLDLKFNLALPDLDHTQAADVQIHFSGSLNGVSVNGAVPDQALTALTANVTMDANGFTLKGQGRIADAPALVDVRRAPRQTGEAAITVTLDDAARAKQNLNTAGTLMGPIAVRFVQALGGAKNKSVKVEADLARAAVNGLFPGWVKPAGRPGKLSFVMHTASKRDDVELQDFVAESAGFGLRGQAVLNKERKLRSARFTQARLSPGDDMRLDLERNGPLMKIVARGNNIDARPFLKTLYEAGGKAKPGEPADYDIDIKSSIVTGHNSEAITNAELKMLRRGADLKHFSLTGKIGGTEIKGGLNGSTLLVLSGNAGSTLRFIDLYRRMIGGTMTLESSIDPARQEGALIVQRYALRDEPALRRVTADGPPAAAGESERVQRRAIASGKSDVPFDRMRVDFVRSQGRLDIKEALMLGPIVGVTLEGIVDAPRDRVNMTGTYVPAFGLNNAFAQIPVVGLFLGGPQTGSLFGVNFKVSGAFSAPAVSINPLSAVAPGFLRKFFEFKKESVEGVKIYRLPDSVGGSQ